MRRIQLLILSFIILQLQINAQTYNLGINPSPSCGGCASSCDVLGYCTPAGTTPTGNCSPALTVNTPNVTVPPNSNVRVQIATRACSASTDGLDGGDFCYVNGTVVVTGSGNTPVNYDQCFTTGATGSTVNVGLTANRRDETIQVIFTISAGAGTGCTPLPSVLRINISSFNGQVQPGGSVKLFWTTESEINNNYTAIEKSTNGYSFSEIGKIYSNGNSTQQKGYDFTDNSIIVNNTYYRLKSVDNNGVETYSKIVLIAGPVNKDVLYVYPNPTSDYIQITSSTLIKEVVLINTDGKTVMQKLMKNTNNCQLLLNGIAKGVYIVKVITEKNILINKVIITE